MLTVKLWFDPTCPYAWLTSRWLLEVEQVRDVGVHFRLMSLSVMNEGRPELAKAVAKGWGPVRVAMATTLSFGEPALRTLYSEIGALIHQNSQRVNRDLYAYALDRAGLPHTLANAALTSSYDDDIRASHYAGVDDLGDTAACPVMQVRNAADVPIALVGPVLTTCPRGEAAGRLWDAVALIADTPGFVDLRGRAAGLPGA